MVDTRLKKLTTWLPVAERDRVDATAFGEANKTWLSGLHDLTLGPAVQTADQIIDAAAWELALKRGAEGDEQ